jgi:hypothetical protein
MGMTGRSEEEFAIEVVSVASRRKAVPPLTKPWIAKMASHGQRSKGEVFDDR